MFSRAITFFSLLAIIAAPLFALVLPQSISGRLVGANVELKDLVLLGCVLILALAVYSARAAEMAIRWFARRPFYRRIDVHYFYLKDGTVIIRNKFDFVNGWHTSGYLPRDDLIWHRPITKSDMFYRFYERGKLRDRTMTSDAPTIISAVPESTPSTSNDHRYSWIPTVGPPLGFKEKISFVVEIMALKTEVAAFAAGTKLGFGVNIPTSKVTLTAHAPFGYRFVLQEPVLTVRRADDLAEIETASSSRPRPTVSPDGSVLTLNVARPRSERRYWVHYKFEPLESSE